MNGGERKDGIDEWLIWKRGGNNAGRMERMDKWQKKNGGMK